MVHDPLFGKLEIAVETPLLRIEMVRAEIDFLERENGFEIDAISSIVEMS